METANSRILLIGGTGSLGSAFLKRLLRSPRNRPKTVTIFSRDEAKQAKLRAEISDELNRSEIPIQTRVQFEIGDVRDVDSLHTAINGQDIVIHAAALKQVDRCESLPDQVVKTNIVGALNIVSVIEKLPVPPSLLVGISTDKACLPVNVMGISKAMQEKIFLSGPLRCPGTRFVSVRYGNVLASRGSVLPLFHRQINQGNDITITHRDCTRFFLPLGEAIDTILFAIDRGRNGEIIVPKIRSCHMIDIAECLAREGNVSVREIGMRPGEKFHEILVTSLEARRLREDESYYIIEPEMFEPSIERLQLPDDWAFTSDTSPLNREETEQFLTENGMKVADSPVFDL